MTDKMIGKKIRIIPCVSGIYYVPGDIGTIVSVDDDGNYWADFNGNARVRGKGIWCIGHDAGRRVFEVID